MTIFVSKRRVNAAFQKIHGIKYLTQKKLRYLSCAILQLLPEKSVKFLLPALQQRQMEHTNHLILQHASLVALLCRMQLQVAA